MSPFIYFFYFFVFQSLTNQFGYFPIHINNFFLAMIGKYLCGENSLTRLVCTHILFKVTGDNLKNFDFKLLPIILGHWPDVVSIKQLLHYGQGITSGKKVSLYTATNAPYHCQPKKKFFSKLSQSAN